MGKKATKTTVKANDGRRRMLAAVNIRWRQHRRDLRHDEATLKDELRSFAAQVCGLANVDSLADLNTRELGHLLDALAPGTARLPACPSLTRPTFDRTHSRPSTSQVGKGTRPGAEITHLASEPQKATLQKLVDFLEWDAPKGSSFIAKRFKSQSLGMLTFNQATKLTRILLNIAVSKEVKRQLGNDVKVTKTMTDAAIPEIKRRLGIDQ
ncbi:MAG TPA: hypothetical protein VJX67_21410 [Blastocatellia bacterium]|nr:hypothetical protein [Blastocatellia bacterium]